MEKKQAVLLNNVSIFFSGFASLDMCQADYAYVGQEHDELTINPGDVITILQRHDDGWWKGELRKKQGLFPASYVHEL